MVTLPPREESDPTLVYLLTPQTSSTSVPVGGHYRFTVSDGAVIEQRAFSNSCLELETAQADEKGDTTNRVAMLAVTHVLDPIPTEIHMFTLLAARTPVLVMTVANRQTWGLSIEDGRPQISNITDLFDDK